MAKAKETATAVIDKLRDLYDLQQIDSKVDEIQILKGELPIEVSDLEDEIAGLETRMRRMEEGITELEGGISKHTANISEAEALIVRYTTQMDNVKNNREYEALMKELEMQKLEIQLSEKKMRESSSSLHNKRETKDAAQARLELKQKALATKKIELEAIIVKTEKDEEKLRKKSDKARKKIGARLLKSYNRIRTNYRNGMAVVTVERNSCGGCFNQIPPQVQMEIATHNNIIACEHCGRILVDETLNNPVVAVAEA
jgi:predicted  nucleic acid-binding Zn-ribbon protein